MKNLRIPKQSYLDLLSKINSKDLDEKIVNLPLILQIRAKIFNRFLPKNPLWQKRFALDLIFCKTANTLCKNYTFGNINDEALKVELYKAGLPEDCNNRALESVIIEMRCFLKLYTDETMLKIDVSTSQILYHRSYFMPANISKNVLLKYMATLA